LSIALVVCWCLKPPSFFPFFLQSRPSIIMMARPVGIAQRPSIPSEGVLTTMVAGYHNVTIHFELPSPPLSVSPHRLLNGWTACTLCAIIKGNSQSQIREE
jgi:hypothetical protein